MWFSFRISMFITSFTPFWLTLVVFKVIDVFSNWSNLTSVRKNICTNRLDIILIIFIVFIYYCCYDTIFGMINKKKKEIVQTKFKLISVEKNSTITQEYLIAYILPIMIISLDNIKSYSAVLIYFSFLLYLNMKNDNIYVNILLAIKGYDIYVCNLEVANPNGESVLENVTVISKKTLTTQSGQSLKYYDLKQKIFIVLED